MLWLTQENLSKWPSCPKILSICTEGNKNSSWELVPCFPFSSLYPSKELLTVLARRSPCRPITVWPQSWNVLSRCIKISPQDCFRKPWRKHLETPQTFRDSSVISPKMKLYEPPSPVLLKLLTFYSTSSLHSLIIFTPCIPTWTRLIQACFPCIFSLCTYVPLFRHKQHALWTSNSSCRVLVVLLEQAIYFIV